MAGDVRAASPGSDEAQEPPSAPVRVADERYVFFPAADLRDHRGARLHQHSSNLMAMGLAAYGIGSRSDPSDVKAQQADATVDSSLGMTRVLSEDDTLRNPMDLERARVKLEVARARLSGPFDEIPVGRVYDTVPDSTGEDEYDALENAYNLAFGAADPNQLEQATRLSRLRSSNGISVSSDPAPSNGARSWPEISQMHETVVSPKKPEASSGTQLALPPLKDALMANPERVTNSELGAGGKISMAGENAKAVAADAATQDTPSIDDTAGEEKHMPDLENHKYPTDATSTGQVSVLKEDRSTDVSPSPSSSLPQSPAPTQTSSPDNTTVTDASPANSSEAPMSPLDVKHELASSDQAATIDPSFANKGVAVGRVRGDENQSLNEYLLSELQQFAAHLLGREPPLDESRANAVSQLTSLQLFRDHQRSLMDFDADCERFHSWSAQRRLHNDEISMVEPPRVLYRNPFQVNHSAPEETQWVAVLDGVMPLSKPRRRPDTSVERPGSARAFYFHKSGLNSLTLKTKEGDDERLSISRFLTQLDAASDVPQIHMIVCADPDIRKWQTALQAFDSLQVYPYWGPVDGRRQLLQLLQTQFTFGEVKHHVILASFDAFADDAQNLSLLPFQVHVIDIPDTSRDKVEAKWTSLLSQRCRQRFLLCSQDFSIDARRLLHFLVPGLFSSRRKFLAWNCAALEPFQIREVCDVLSAFIILSEDASIRRFISHVAGVTQDNCELEFAALGMLNRQGIVRSVVPNIVVPTKSVIKKERHGASEFTPTKKKTTDSGINSPASTQSSKLSIRKRRESGHSRKRISRCGKCSGCLSEDCMQCGHCKDMKKYGGPGLRKQSCKKRKCLHPKSWGLPSKRRRRAKKDGEADDFEGSMLGDSDDDFTGSYSSMESDRESTRSSLRFSASGLVSDSDTTRFSDDSGLDSPRTNLLLPASDTALDDNLSLSDLSPMSSRSRVVRCGRCAGCTAEDCMNCRHCKDMKKYGGPGLRKQSCKNRKCIDPKIVRLNQGKDNEYVDETGKVISIDDLEPSEFSDPSETAGQDADECKASASRTTFLSVVQECELFVEPRLVFQCSICMARFISKPFMDFHKRIEHSSAGGSSNGVESELDRQASGLFLHPITQNSIITSQLRQQDRSRRACPLGYAKLEGSEFQYFLIEPYVVLGRLGSYWRKLYTQLGVRDLKGLPGGDVDCHVGNDSTIAGQHAVISWDAQRGHFTIECLSSRSSISVNGQVVSASSPPVALRSRSLVQIGASVFYFLLPRSTFGSRSEFAQTKRCSQLRRDDVRSWLEAAVEKRRVVKTESDSQIAQADQTAAEVKAAHSTE